MKTGVHHILYYDYVPDILERRAPYRDGHLALLGRWAEAGLVVAAGAVGDPPTGAAIVFRVEDPAEQIGEYVASDPYVAAGLVTERRVVPWTVAVAGGSA